MAENSTGRLHTTTYPVEDLVEYVRSGRVRIPTFQRGLRWTRKDVKELFDSIVRGYPIGNLLLWQRRAEPVRDLQIGALSVTSEAIDQAWFVVDGQQRLTSLASALSPAGLDDHRFALAYDVIEGDFVPYAPGLPSTTIPLPTIFELTELLQWFTAHPELQGDPSFIQRANKVAKAIREFKVPLYIVEQSEASVLRDIFDRMNNYGKQLTRAEVFTALHEQQTDEKRGEGGGRFGDIAEQVHARTGFGLLDESTVFLAFLARRGPDVSREIRREFLAPSLDRDSNPVTDFKNEKAEDAQSGATSALVRAVEFLQNQAGIPHFAFLPYRYILITLARFYALHPHPVAATERNLRRWVWRAALAGPGLAKGSATGAIRTLASRISGNDADASVAQLLSAVSGPYPIPRVTEFKTNWAATRIALCAMWDRHPIRISLGADETSTYTADELRAEIGESTTAVAQVPMIVQGRDYPVRERALAGNRLLVVAGPEDADGDWVDVLESLARAERAGSSTAIATLRSHLIDAEAADALARGDMHSFVNHRQATIQDAIVAYIQAQAEWGFEDTPPLDALVIDDDEADRDDDLEIEGAL